MRYSKFILGLLLFLSPYVGYTQVCETPNNNQAILFQPCTWDIGNDAGPLSRVAGSQNYVYTEITDAAATVMSFLATSGTGILQIGSHASPIALLVEAYPPTSAGIHACTTSYNNLIAAGFTRKEITKVRCRYLVGIAITNAGIRNRWADNNSIVLVGACYSIWLGDDFNSREYFGYWDPTTGRIVRHDATLLFSRMDGTTNVGNRRPAGDAFAGGGFTEDFVHRTKAGGRTTLAPRVTGVSPLGAALPPGTHPGYVEFDTKMKSNPPAGVLTMTRPDYCTAHLIDQRWASDNRLEFTIDNSACAHYPEPGIAALIFTVHNELAVSRNNERELDGGGASPTRFISGIGPNRDDFIVTRSQCTGGKEFAVVRGSSLTCTTPLSGMQDDTVDIIEDTIVMASSPASFQYSLFTIRNVRWLDNVTFVATDLIGEGGVIPRDSVSFDPDTLWELPPDTIGKLILLGVGIPTGQPQGDYIGRITVDAYAFDGTYYTDSLTLVVKVNHPPIITVSDTFVSVSIGDTVQLIVSATDPEGDSIGLYANMYPFAAWLEETGQDSLVFYFSPDSADTGLTFGAVFYADDGVLKVGKPVIIEVLRVGVEEDGMLMPEDFFMGQNYPNPFFQTTKIEYWIPYSAEVKITVYNLAGQKVATLVDGKKGPGRYTTSWDGRDDRGRALSRGIYFYRLETAEIKATRKLILLR